jgi:membrane protease YdiL (CAAX protease family)
MALLDYFAIALTVTPYLALSAPEVVRALQQPGKRWKRMRTAQHKKAHGLIYSAALLLPYLLAALPHIADDPFRFARELLLMALYLLAPMLLQSARLGNARRPDGLDLLTILVLWLPVELSWLPQLPGIAAPVPMLLGVVNALLIYLVIAPWKTPRSGKGGIGYTFRLTAQDVGVAVLALVAFAFVALPLGLVTGFLQFESPPVPSIGEALVALGMGYLITAIPEELLFRGLIQNGLERLFPKAQVATLAASALIFGIAHLNSATPGLTTPNWIYALVAALAGLAYGYVWRKTGKITASAITHGLVNATWALLLGG